MLDVAMLLAAVQSRSESGLFGRLCGLFVAAERRLYAAGAYRRLQRLESKASLAIFTTDRGLVLLPIASCQRILIWNTRLLLGSSACR
jgi:hypothetical protein